MPTPRKKPLPPLPIKIEPINIRLIKLRKRRGITQMELAKKIGTTRDVLAGYESGRAHFNEDMAIRLCLALKVSADELLGIGKNLEHLERPPNIRLMRRMHLIQSLSSLDQKAVIRTIDTLLKGLGIQQVESIEE